VYTGFSVGQPAGMDHLEYSGLDRGIILRWILRKRDGEWTGLIWLGLGTGGGHL
jgi:hypothetical protein